MQCQDCRKISAQQKYNHKAENKVFKKIKTAHIKRRSLQERDDKWYSDAPMRATVQFSKYLLLKL